MSDDNEDLKFLPMTMEDFFPIKMEDIPKHSLEPIYRSQKNQTNEIYGHTLSKGKYDITYVITLLRIIHDQTEKMKLNPRDLSFTLTTSLKKLIAMLEVEREQDGR